MQTWWLLLYKNAKKENILKYKNGEKSMKVPFIIYADSECLLGKIDICHNNPEKSSTTKNHKHTASGYSLFSICSFDVSKKVHDYYRNKVCMKSFCKDLKEHATKIINHEKKKWYYWQLKKTNHIRTEYYLYMQKGI